MRALRYIATLALLSFFSCVGESNQSLVINDKDYFEEQGDWPFFWAENEGTIVGNTAYIIFGSAFKALVKGN